MRLYWILIISFLFYRILICPKVKTLFLKILLAIDLIDIDHFEILAVFCQLQHCFKWKNLYYFLEIDCLSFTTFNSSLDYLWFYLVIIFLPTCLFMKIKYGLKLLYMSYDFCCSDSEYFRFIIISWSFTFL